MWERTITISSVSKSFSVTGFRVGWSIGPKQLIDIVSLAHRFGTGVACTPTQEAIARCIETEIPRLNEPNSHFTTQTATLQTKRDILIQLLTEAGFKPCVPDAGYFICADWTSVATIEEIEDGSNNSADTKFSMWLMKHYKIAMLPVSPFYDPNTNTENKYVRVSFFITDELLNESKVYFDNLRNRKSGYT